MQFSEVWNRLQGGDKPTIDFNSSFVVAHVRDAADPNGHRFSGRVKEGELELMTLSTLIGFQPSDKTVTTLIEFSRKGVISFKAYDPKTRKYKLTPLLNTPK